MSQRETRSWTISNDEIDSKTQSRISKLFHLRDGQGSHSIPTLFSPLPLACQNNDLDQVKLCLKKMKRKEIDYQYPPNNETALHVATRNQHKEMIRLLLDSGAQRSLRNMSDQQAHHLAETKEIEDLFKRPKSCRFAFLQKFHKTTTNLSQNKITCESCSLVNDNTFYEWELVDRNASHKALRFRRELQPSVSLNEKDFKQKLYSINKGYIETRLQHISAVDSSRIQDYFDRALREQNPYYIVTAYTICQHFSELLNTDMARNVIHDLKNGCSKFSCDCLYSTEDGTKSITNILLHHPNFQKYRYKGEVYRGIIVPKNALDHYHVGSCIITTTFLSTSKDPAVGRVFCDKGTINSATHSFFCIYEIFNDDRTALDISKISEFECEDEVLILPYSAFLITKIEEGQETTNIYLREQCLTHMFDNDGPLENSAKLAVRLLELVGKGLSQKKNEILSEEDDYKRPRSKTMPG